MYAIYKETHPPTGVEFCVNCHFYSARESNLVVAGTTEVRVFRLCYQQEDSSSAESGGSSLKRKLELVGQHSLFGNIESLHAIRLAGNTRDSLLMSFKDAKLSIVDYDPGKHDIKTRSLHFFEDEKIKSHCLAQDRAPVVRIDPERRCAVMLAYGTHLVVLPFRQEGGIDDTAQDSIISSSDRPPVLPSYIIDVKEIDEKTCNILDIQFLHGYYEPTLLILYEPLKTWAGRLAMRNDTCALVAVSLNMSQKAHPVVWQLSCLPFDCIYVMPVPKPIGGVLVCCMNALLYLNQSVPPYGVSVNSIGENSTVFPLKPQKGVTITLEGSNAIFIANDKLVFSLKGGEIYVVTLIADGVRSVRNFVFDKTAASVLTSCVCECGDGYLFLGSRLGNSLLVKYTEKPQDIGGDLFSPGVEPPNAKRRRIDSDYAYALDDLDELEVYGAQQEAGVELTSYTFEVCDSLLNIGPCSCMDIGEPAFLSEEFADAQELDLEVVSCSGYGKNGALTVLQRSIRPQVVTTFELPGCTDMWTVFSKDQESTEGNEKYHSFLILSREDSSMILKTEQEIMEVDQSGFSTQCATIYAGNFGNGSYILQVTPLGVRLLEGVNQLQHIPMDSGLSNIVWCSVCDPYAVLLMADGSVILIEFIKSASGPKLTVSRPSLSQSSKVCACCTYKDMSGLFTTENSNLEEVSKVPSPKPEMTAPPRQEKESLTIDEEDELLYGGDTSLTLTFEPPEPSKAESATPVEVFEEPLQPSYWCLVCRENGVMEIYSLPGFTRVFFVKNFSKAPRVIVDSGDSGASTQSSVSEEESLNVREVLLTGLGYKNRRATLVAVMDQDLLIYEAFSYPTVEGHLNLRFKKLQHNIQIREKKPKQEPKNDSETKSGLDPKVAMLRVFNDISSYSGIFVCGSYPFWIFVTNRGAFHWHPMSIDGPVTCFAAFHNVNCPKGFLYFNTRGELRISVLPTHLSYDSPWPVRKVPLRYTPHMVSYNRESKTYAIVTSEQEPCKKIPRVTAEDKEFVDTIRDARFIYPSTERFVLQLISPISWEVIPNTRHDLDEWEHVTTMKNLLLHSEETHTGRKGFICVGTTQLYGEEIAVRGRILIFDIIEVVPEPGQPLTKNKFKLLYEKEQKGPVTALNQVNGYLVSGIGQKIYIWNFTDNDLVGMAFIDTQLYIHSLVTIRNFVIAADVCKSITLLRLQEETKTLAFVSKDPKNLEVYAADFFIDGPQIGFLVSDVEKNLVLFTYQPEAIESQGGQRLLQRADINVGTHITSFFRIAAKAHLKASGEKSKEMRQLTCFGTLDGALGLMLPMTEKTFRRLHMLQTKLVDCIPHVAGLNPKAFRMLQWRKRKLCNPHRNVLDWQLLFKYMHLSFMERQEVARKIGTTPAQIMDDMMDIERACAQF
ncbi:cleavage and polyadenylation specificity factor subunit 1 isoform X2 [Nematostella vectensis]|uniref:cleavage and polyadenylation specificity factor subunit 1 isoform X1 n=1 Tax=Nematostella vectensis TaxID=45351 RepID=UPI0020777E20|nr:cleavage and polyadenylation specificity factor subunit 1 isoform X1 [Nematostella vectensis]XP_048576874.1 cleavage and polyadenylation specificity factor subunit 1 isoform X2 [Nematostella vectensis]